MSEPTIVARPNGPLRVTGPITITDPTGQEISIPAGVTVSLCRCGHSTERPFCSGAHKEIGFQSLEPITRSFTEG
ncbi:MAG TPA: CDGSH iron-sulfur domain-containing protein [Candidatus Dormibacteraeota bacterium]|nr:CDGSH iron-sulfur domain-containing protein [Candidatus Dormibacteraeota bacterium]